jgi:hypothetical protein
VITVITCLTHPTVGDAWRPMTIQAAGTTVKVRRSDQFDSFLDSMYSTGTLALCNLDSGVLPVPGTRMTSVLYHVPLV